MEIKKIYNHGVLTHELYVNESDTDEIIAKMGLNESLKDDLSYYLKNNECIFIQRGGDYVLMVDNKEYTSVDIPKLANKEKVEDAKPYQSLKQNKNYGFNKK